MLDSEHPPSVVSALIGAIPKQHDETPNKRGKRKQQQQQQSQQQKGGPNRNKTNKKGNQRKVTDSPSSLTSSSSISSSLSSPSSTASPTESLASSSPSPRATPIKTSLFETSSDTTRDSCLETGSEDSFECSMERSLVAAGLELEPKPHGQAAVALAANGRHRRQRSESKLELERPEVGLGKLDAKAAVRGRVRALDRQEEEEQDEMVNEKDQPELDEKLASRPGGALGVKSTLKIDTSEDFKAELVWRNIILFVILHSSFPIGVYMLYTQRCWLTLGYSIVCMYASALGVTGGAHRLWSHRAYKASLPVQLLLMALQTMAGQNSIYTWSRDHRVHHKFSETNADPHNINRGFFFAHMGWLCCKKHDDVKIKGKLIDLSDLEANKVVMFQHRHFWWLAILFTVLLPTMIPVWLWGEKFWTSFIFSFMIRYMITLHGTWLVNSAAHYIGSRPYDKRIEARESPYAIYNGLGEGFHNYHHTFPYDYAASEFGKYFNITTAFIDLCAKLNLVTDRRLADRSSVEARRKRTGDLSNNLFVLT